LPLHRIVPHATATTELYTLSLHDALPIFHKREHLRQLPDTALVRGSPHPPAPDRCFLLRPQTGRRIPHQRAHVPRRQSLPSPGTDRKSTRLNSSHVSISYAVFCLKKKKNT